MANYKSGGGEVDVTSIEVLCIYIYVDLLIICLWLKSHYNWQSLKVLMSTSLENGMAMK